MTASMLWVEDSDTDVLLMEFAAADTRLAGRYERAADVADGVELAASAIARGAPHRLVVVDMRLPGGTGLDVVRAMQGRWGDPLPHRVLLTSSSDPTDVERAATLGCTHRQKPLRLDDWRTLASDLAALMDEP